MSTDVIDDLVRVYSSSVPPDVTAGQFGKDIARVLATMMAIAESEAARLMRGARIGTATGLFLDLHARDHGLRRSGGEADEQLQRRLQTPPKAGTVGAVLASVEAIVEGAFRATLDVAPLTLGSSDWDSVFESRIAGVTGNTLQLESVAGSLLSVQDVGSKTVLTFVDGATTVADAERAIDENSLLLRTRQSGSSPTYPLVTGDDDFGPTFLAGGSDPLPTFLIELPLRSLFWDRSGFFDEADARIGGGRGVVVVLIPAVANALSSVSAAVRSKISAGKIPLVSEYT